MSIEWWTQTLEGDKAMTIVMRDFIAQAKAGDWTAETGWFTLSHLFRRFALTHPKCPPDNSDWTNDTTMNAVVLIMRKVANGEPVDDMLAD